jgi:hypothetical protein
MRKTNVGANLVFALRTKIELKPMFENELETLASGIGSQTIVVRRAKLYNAEINKGIFYAKTIKNIIYLSKGMK